MAFGIFLVNVVGLPTVDHQHYWRFMLLLSLAFVAIQFFGLLVLGYETPRWLVQKGKTDKARACCVVVVCVLVLTSWWHSQVLA